ncbi:SH2 domain-containing protein 2A isoform X1 [Bufo gargarizans]|uniref:SH2 domain-containing protein 2A isoform X1 n=1 Tax=Bufo gargarizans TaxID=30331 RepID=UPI001CF30DE1|nr:SH2 domain-containing protein 2A isoform X1 [Bufo gargarizans]
MAYDYQNDYPPILFSTFKPIPPNKDVPGSHTPCHEENMDSSATISVPKETSGNTGAGLKDQTYQWFERTQRKKMLKNGRFADWFHGFITRNRAEEILQDKQLGCFLIRFCESRVGFVLSYRGTERCRHFIINQLEDERYVIEGEKSVHPSLQDLVSHYCRFPVEPYKEMLTTACPTNPFKHKVSSLMQDSTQDMAASSLMYAKISKQNQAPPDTTIQLSTSPKEKNKLFCEVKIPVEYASPQSVKKDPAFPKKEPIPSPQDHDPLLTYAPVRKLSGDDESDVDVESPSLTPTYNPPAEIHTYAEPDLWDRPRVESRHHATEESIAFYAVGRGSCKDISENVYSEVDVNSMSCSSRAAWNRLGGLSTLPQPAPKAVKHKTTAFHSSFRSHNPQNDARRRHCSRSHTKPHATLQLDDPMYGRGHLQHTGPLAPDEENIYEKIPENCAAPLKNNRPGKKGR